MPWLPANVSIYKHLPYDPAVDFVPVALVAGDPFMLTVHPALPVLISSGQPSVEDWDCFRRPGVAVIPKPFTMGEIQEKLAGFGSLR